MSFTIKCNKCGYEQIFTSTSQYYEDNISIYPNLRGTWAGDEVKSLSIDCENPKCDNTIEIK